MGSSSTQAGVRQLLDNGGGQSYCFSLKLRYGGRIQQSLPPKYLGGKVSTFSDIDSDEWGIMSLREKVVEVGFNKDDYLRFFTVNEKGLLELVSDLETWNLVNNVVRPKVVEIWVIIGVNGDDADVDADLDVDADTDEEEGDDSLAGSDWEEGDSANEQLEDFEGSENEIDKADNQDFVKHVDSNSEYGGVKVPSFVESEKQDNKLLNDDGVNHSDDGAGRQDVVTNAVRHIPQLPSPLWLGRTFSSKGEFKDAVKGYAIQFGKELKLMKNDKVRCVAKCKQAGCMWQVTCRIDKDEQTWGISSFNDKHEGCPWVHDNKFVTSSLIAKRWKNEIAGNSNWTLKEFRKMVCTEEHIGLTKRKAFKAMAKAKTEIKGELEDNFNKIWSYCMEIEKKNPNTTYVVKLSDLIYEGGKRRFMRMYLCWDACKEGVKHCRPIIGVDGCHLKGKAGGMLLTAIGVDGNEGIFPIAYAIVEGETKDSWCWFLELLKMDIGLTYIREQDYTFMSDKQKGLIPAFEEVLPMVSHRYCVRHLHGNMKVAGFGGQPIKDALWKAARATTVTSFTTTMAELKALDIDAFKWLGDKHPTQWSRSHFSPIPKCDMLVNNICECFNGMILDARDSPLINCLEILRKQVMIRLFENRKQATKWSGLLCPVVTKKLAVFEKQAGGYWAYQSADDLFDVKGAYDQHEVDLKARTCSCRKWELTGIPCRHVIAAIWVKKHSVYDYVDPCYRIETYLKAYAGSIHPMAGAHEWPISNRQPPLPPLFTAKIGRPKKLRKKSAGESTKDGVHIARKLVSLHCSKCQQKGHNTRRCPNRSNNAAAAQREDEVEEIPINTQPALDIDELLATYDIPVQAIDDIGLLTVGVDPLLNSGDTIIGNNQVQVHENPSENTQVHMENTPNQVVQPHTKSKGQKSLGLTKKKRYRTRSSTTMKFTNDSSNAIQLD